MNGRQAAKAAAEKIEQLEYANKLYTLDVRAYNAVIMSMIGGGSPCGWCHDHGECQKQEKDGTGCDEWVLVLNMMDEPKEEKTEDGPIHGVEV